VHARTHNQMGCSAHHIACCALVLTLTSPFNNLPTKSPAQGPRRQTNPDHAGVALTQACGAASSDAQHNMVPACCHAMHRHTPTATT
jgi:hypothetical protein